IWNLCAFVCSQRAEHRFESNINAVILRTAKACTFNRNNLEVNLGLHILTHCYDVISNNFRPTSAKYKELSLIHISEPTRRTPISYAVFCLKKKKKNNYTT